MSKSDYETLRIKKDAIKHLKRTVFKFHNRCNVSKHIRENLFDNNHNNDGVANDICDKLKATGEYEILQEPGNTDKIAVKIKNTSFKERYWLVVLLIGALIGFLFSMALELWKESRVPKKNQSPQALQALTHTYDHTLLPRPYGHGFPVEYRS